jgi:hypothetical protein
MVFNEQKFSAFLQVIHMATSWFHMLSFIAANWAAGLFGYPERAT